MFHTLNPLVAPRARLYLFPHAGGSWTEFRDWAADAAADEVEVSVLDLPGRMTRPTEPPIADVPTIAERAADRLADDLPYALVGHSFGAIVAYETCRAVEGRDVLTHPRTLVVAALPDPASLHRLPAIHLLPDREFLEALDLELDGVPAEVFDHPELLAVVAGALRADYAALTAYTPPADRLAVDVLALRAEGDSLSGAAVQAWRDWTWGSFRVETFAGGHFFLRERHHRARLLDLLREQLLDDGTTAPVSRRVRGGGEWP